MRELELLAPAKNLECGLAAVNSGADAVYIAAERFGARQAVGNSVEDIAELCRYAHLFGCKVYVTVNTILYDSELDDAQALINRLYDIGADAILVQDMALLKMDLPPITLHASTQTDNRSAEKVRWLSSCGFKRVVLARELSLTEIGEIHRVVPGVEMEAFVHGALCVSYSGECYASQYCFGRSANRGACAQFCRLKFDLIDGNGQTIDNGRYFLSLKDLCRIGSLERMADAGVTSFKIEGRLKDANYVRNVTAAYSRKLDEIIERRPTEYRRASRGRCTIAFHPDLKKTFNRGFTEYFLDGRRRDIVSLDTPKAIGEYVGKVKEVRGNTFTVAGTADFANGDGLCFINRQRELEGVRINRVENNRLFPFKMPRTLRAGMALYRNSDIRFDRTLSDARQERLLPLTLTLECTPTGCTLYAKAKGTDSMATVTRDNELQPAKTPQTENIKRQLSKLGGTIFFADDVSVETEGGSDLFVPNSLLSDMRRECVELLMVSLEHNARTVASDGGATPAGGTTSDGGATSAGGTTHKLQQPYHYGYMYNVSNRMAEAFYKERGFGDIAPAFELRHPSNPQIMQCRYCLRNSLGACRKRDEGAASLKEPLRLRLPDGRLFRLEFDCKNCQMNIYAEE